MQSNENHGWRWSTHLFIIWTLLVVAGCVYDLVGPDRVDDLGNTTNGEWTGRAIGAWLVTLLVFGAYRGLTRRHVVVVPATAPASDLDELAKLAELRERGALTDDEFEQRKARLLTP